MKCRICIKKDSWDNTGLRLGRSSVRAKSDCILVFMWHFRDRSEEASDSPRDNCSQDTSAWQDDQLVGCISRPSIPTDTKTSPNTHNNTRVMLPLLFSPQPCARLNANIHGFDQSQDASSWVLLQCFCLGFFLEVEMFLFSVLFVWFIVLVLAMFLFNVFFHLLKHSQFGTGRAHWQPLLGQHTHARRLELSVLHPDSPRTLQSTGQGKGFGLLVCSMPIFGVKRIEFGNKTETFKFCRKKKAFFAGTDFDDNVIMSLK